jgi:hypothetical protein
MSSLFFFSPSFFLMLARNAKILIVHLLSSELIRADDYSIA